MFTGLVEEVGRLQARRPRGGAIELEIACRQVVEHARLGDSIAVDGVCLTVERLLGGSGFVAFASPETLERTAIGQRPIGSAVNLETSLTLSKPLGGHLMQGHVDGLGRLGRVHAVGEAWDVTVELPASLAVQCVEKGSIALDGISLTIARLDGNSVTIAVIPATWQKTSLRDRHPGDAINVETDIIGKYVRRMLETRGLLAADATGSIPEAASGVTLDLLRRAGML